MQKNILFKTPRPKPIYILFFILLLIIGCWYLIKATNKSDTSSTVSSQIDYLSDGQPIIDNDFLQAASSSAWFKIDVPRVISERSDKEEITESNITIKSKDGDINGDGLSDKIFLKVGSDCGSCHLHFIDLLVEGKYYQITTNEGDAFPRKDGKGFYLTYSRNGQEDAYHDPDNYLISNFEWNGQSFTEIAQKIVWVTSK